jgi:hypothetical protein
MTRSRHHEPIVDLGIKRLAGELYCAQRTIIELGTELALEFEKHLPPSSAEDYVAPFPGTVIVPREREAPLEQLLTGWHTRESEGDFYTWLHGTLIKRIIELAIGCAACATATK